MASLYVILLLYLIMTTAYLDCEFNEYQGGLISLALVVNEDRYFYEVLDCDYPKPWVKEHVMPILNKPAISKELFQNKLETFINGFSQLDIVADWPDDIRYFAEALITGPGEMLKTPNLSFHLKRIDAPSALPHNALADAIGIMKYCNLPDTSRALKLVAP